MGKHEPCRDILGNGILEQGNGHSTFDVLLLIDPWPDSDWGHECWIAALGIDSCEERITEHQFPPEETDESQLIPYASLRTNRTLELFRPWDQAAEPLDTDEDLEPSASEIIASLASSESPASERRKMILIAEIRSFDATEAETLKSLLRRYIDQHHASEQSDELVAVASAVRKYVSLLSVAHLPTVAELIQADRKTSLPFEVEVAKMVTRKLTATLPEDTIPFLRLGDELSDLANGYSTPRMLSKRYYGAVALDSMLSLALLRSPHLPSLTNRLRTSPVNWFRATVKRQALVLREELARRFSIERYGQASECLTTLAVAAERP